MLQRDLRRVGERGSPAAPSMRRRQTGAAAANERLQHWREALEGYANARQTWSALRELHALAPEDATQPERMSAAMARCEQRAGAAHR